MADSDQLTLALQFILEPVPVEKPGDMPVLLEPFLAALRQERYIYITFLHLWGYPLSYENTATIVSNGAVLNFYYFYDTSLIYYLF